MNEITDKYINSDVKIIDYNECTLEEALSELNGLIGLEKVKQQIKGLVNNKRLNDGLKLYDLDGTKSSYHFVFTGNPGTGKTTVAKILAKILKCLNVLSRGQYVEATRDNLVAHYSGQTAPKTMDALNKATRGILLIDEAYSLVNSENDNFGIESVNIINDYMEKNRDDFTLIIAGNSDKIDRFMQSNEGFNSRFREPILFEDYTPKELFQIFLNFINKGPFKLSEEASETVEKYIYSHKFAGNARDMRSLYEKIVESHSSHIFGNDANKYNILELEEKIRTFKGDDSNKFINQLIIITKTDVEFLN